MDQSKVILSLSHTYALAQLGSILFMNFNREYLRKQRSYYYVTKI